MVALALAAASLAGCAADPNEDDATTGDDAEVIKASKVTLEEGDNGKTVSMNATGTLVLKVRGIHSAGYSWKVVSTDRTFGYPEETSASMGPPGAIGAASMISFTWKKNPLLQSGETHTVKLEYKRAWENKPAEKKFEFTVKIK
jgi:predicted secreted protein